MLNFTLEKTIEDEDSVTQLFRTTSSSMRIALGIFLQIILISSLHKRYYIFKFLSLSKSHQGTINSIYWFEQVSQLCFVFTLNIYSLALFSPVQLSQFLGTEFCKWVRLPSGIYVCGCPLWSCIVAIFRLILLRGNTKIVQKIGIDKLASGLVAIGIIIQSICVSLLVKFDDTSFITRMCFHGMVHFPQPIGSSARVVLNVALFGLFVSVLEMICYILIFVNIFYHDNSILAKNILNPKVVHQRNRRNVVTMFGQVSTWCLQIAFVLLGGFFSALCKTNLLRDSASVLKVVEFLIYPVLIIKTSPPIRKFFST